MPSSAYERGIRDLLAGQSGCREQPISAQGSLERVLQADPGFLAAVQLFRGHGPLLQGLVASNARSYVAIAFSAYTGGGGEML